MNAAFTSVGLRRQSARLWIGAEVQPVDRVVARNFRSPFPNCVFVNSIDTGSFADRAGLRSGDIIFKLNGRWVYSMNDLVERLGRYSKEDKVRLSIVRNGRKQDIYLTADMMSGNATPVIQTPPSRQRIAGRAFMRNQAMQQPRLALPPAPMANTPSVVPKEFEWLGIEMDPINSAIVRDHPSLSGIKGALVTEVSRGSKGYLAGVSPRDIILSINRIPVDSAKTLNDAINSADLQNGVLLDIERQDRRMYVIIN